MLSTGIVLGLARLFTPEETRWTGRALSELAYMVIGSNLAYAFWERAMRRGDIILVAACSYFTPLLSTIISTLYLGIVAGIKLWIGCALIITGAIVCKLAVKENKNDR
jgi:drug/metabolite transporter (DMT)-like permease